MANGVIYFAIELLFAVWIWVLWPVAAVPFSAVGLPTICQCFGASFLRVAKNVYTVRSVCYEKG